jgi:hypothetical protein
MQHACTRAEGAHALCVELIHPTSRLAVGYLAVGVMGWGDCSMHHCLACPRLKIARGSCSN